MENFLTIENFHKAIEVALVLELLTNVVGTVAVDRLTTVPLCVGDGNTKWRARIGHRDIVGWIPQQLVKLGI